MQKNSRTYKQIWESLEKIIPILDPSRYKGLNGKIGVIGGCFEYTGAPFYAAISAIKGGSDISHIFCTSTAGIPIKSYSPEVIVHPCLLTSDTLPVDYQTNMQSYDTKAVDDITKWYPGLTSIVIGPGLGRDVVISQYLYKLVERITTQNLTFDADFLWYLIGGTGNINEPHLNEGVDLLLHKTVAQKAKQCVFTPNIVEFGRL